MARTIILFLDVESKLSSSRISFIVLKDLNNGSSVSLLSSMS